MQTRPNHFADVLKRISSLPEPERVDAILRYFVEVLDTMDSVSIRDLRDQVMERFSTCGCSYYTCEMMIAFINAHLGLRALERSIKSSI